jgi:general secretion pathway protein A
VKEFEIPVESNHKSDLVDALFQHFLQAYSDGGRCVIVVDEAQNLPLDSFEELRMLSNLEAGSEFLVQIVLVGQPQLKVRLMDPALAQLTQRISVHYHLSPISQDEVGNYIEHRLLVSGYDRSEPVFTRDAVCCVASFSQGIPRVISSICDAAMTYAFADDVSSISEGIIERVILDNELLFLSWRQDDGDAVLNSGFSDVLPAVPKADESQLTGVYAELKTLEARVKALESAEQDKAVMVLRELLAEEKERSRQNAQKATLLEMRCKNLASMVEMLKKGQKAAIEKSQEPRRAWRLFRGGKT